MYKFVPSLLAASFLLTGVGCTADQLAAAERLADKYLAQVSLTSTDENGNTTAIRQDEVASVEVDGAPVATAFSADGELQLPPGDFSRDRQVRVRLRDGSIIVLPLGRNDGTREGQLIKFNGALHRQGGKIVAADVLPGGNVTEANRVAALQKRYVVIRINRPGLAGRLKARGIDRFRLPQDAFFVSDRGDLLINRNVFRRYAKPGSKLWAVVQTSGKAAGQGGPGARGNQRLGPGANGANGARHVLFVLQLKRVPVAPPPPAAPSDGAVSADTTNQEIVLEQGTDVVVVSDETNGAAVTNPDAFVLDDAAAVPTPTTSPSPAATATPAPAATATPEPTATPASDVTATPTPAATPTPSALP